MKILSESKALARLNEIKSEYRDAISHNYERRAKSCQTCLTPGACCLDEHFVNIHISRLEAVAIRQQIKTLSPEKQCEINARSEKTVEKYDLERAPDSFAKTFACPLFERNAGCLIHSVKPVPCIQHACYERLEDLPPDELQTKAESEIERLNFQTYRQNLTQLPLPVWLKKLNQEKKSAG